MIRFIFVGLPGRLHAIFCCRLTTTVRIIRK